MADRWPPTTISDYYRAAIEQLKGEVEATADDRVLGMDVELWIDYLTKKFAMHEIEFDVSRQESLVEEEVTQTMRHYDVFSDRSPGDVVRSMGIRVHVPVMPSETLQEIWRHKLAPNSYSMVHYPEHEYDDARGTIHGICGPDAGAIRGLIDKIKASVGAYNASIVSENGNFRSKVSPVAHSKRQRVENKHATLDSLAAAVGIPLVKKTDPAMIVPTAPRVRPSIAPVMPPPVRKAERPVLETDKLNAILELIDSQGRAFERTPQAYTALTEEGLRDIILGSLNAVFQGSATGEAFASVGKVDIHLRISQGELFLAEVKFWGGPATLKETIDQLLSRLTWRDGFGVAIIFSTNASFTDVLATVDHELTAIGGYIAGTKRALAQNHLAAKFVLPSDAKRQVEIRLLGYNLYVSRPGKRQTRRAANS